MDRGSGVFIKYGVAARELYMFFNFVNVLLVVEYDGGVAYSDTLLFIVNLYEYQFVSGTFILSYYNSFLTQPIKNKMFNQTFR